MFHVWFSWHGRVTAAYPLARRKKLRRARSVSEVSVIAAMGKHAASFSFFESMHARDRSTRQQIRKYNSCTCGDARE